MKTRSAVSLPSQIAAEPTSLERWRAGLAPVVATMLTALAVATVYSTQSIFGELAAAFGVERARTRLTFSVASLFYALAFFVLGPLTDRFKKTRMAFVGAVALTLAMLVASRVPTFDGFLLAMGAVGVCAASVPVAMFPYMVQIAPKARVGSYLGLIISASIIGIIVGRSATGILAAHWGWRRAFDVIALLLGLVSALTLSLPNPEAANHKAPGSLFAAYRRAVALMVQPNVGTLLLAGFLLFFGYLGIITFLTFRLQMPPFHYSSSGIGWISLTGMTAIFGAPVAGALSHRIGVRAMILFGMSVALTAMQAIAWGNQIAIVVVGMMGLYLGVFSGQPSLLVLITQRAPREALGSASALYLLACLGGGSAASGALGPIWSICGWTGVSLACMLALVLALVLAAIVAKAAPLRRG